MLKIHHVELENFCQHENLRIEFPERGLVGIFGPNGSGKSNLVNAIRGALTGAFRGHPDGTAGWIRQNQDGDTFVEVAGSIGGTDFRVRRDITKKGVTHRLWHEDRCIHGAAEVENWFRGKFRLSTQVVAEFLFVTQQDLFDFVRGTDGDRSKKFAILCGTTELDKTREGFEQLMKQDRTRFETAAGASLELLSGSLESVRNGRAEIDAKLEACRRRIAASGGTTELERRSREMIARAEKIRNRLTRLDHAQTERDKASRQYEACRIDGEKQRELTLRQKEKKDAVIREGRNAKQALADLLDGRDERELVEELTSLRQELASRDALHKTIAMMREKLRELPEPAPVDQAERRRLEEEWSSLCRETDGAGSRRETVLELIAVHERLGGGTESSACRLCGADAEHWNIDPTSLQDEATALDSCLPAMKRKRESLKKELETLKKREEDFDKNRKDRNTLHRTIGKVEAELAGLTCSNRDVETELTALERARKAVEEALHRFRTCDSLLTREQEILQQKQRETESALSEKERLTTEYEKLRPDRTADRRAVLDALEQELQANATALADAREIERRITSLEGARKESARQQESLEKQIAEQRRLREASGGMTDWFETFGRSVGWLRKDGIPRLIHRSVLQTVVDGINGELGHFDQPFTVGANDDLTFTARFEDGRRIHSKVLSKGQTVMLTTSTWWAFNRTFHLGLMIFDEPSDGLDPENRRFFYEVIELWKANRHKRNQQCVIVSVDEEMAGVFDAVYRLGEGWRNGTPAPRRVKDSPFHSVIG